MQITILVKEKAGAVRPKGGEKRESAYWVTELNSPNPSLLLGLIEVRGNPSVLTSVKAVRDIAKKGSAL